MEQFQLNDELIIKIADLISVKKNSTLKKLVEDIHFADMADIINLLSEEQTKKGNLVLIGSTAGIYGEAGHSDYAAAKGAITSGLLKTLKNEAAQIGNVRVNAIAPGWTLTDKKINEGLNEKHVEKVVSTMALKKLAKPEDIANSAIMLASDSLSNHITGQVIEIAGGMEGRQIVGTK